MTTVVPKGSTAGLSEAVSNAAAVGGVRPGKTLQDEIRALEPQLAAGIPPGTFTPERFIRTVLTEIRKTPRLLECSRESFLGAMMQVAQLGLEVGDTMGHAYLIPYRNRRMGTTECQLQIGYKGFIALAYRGGIIMESREVHENDEFWFDFAQDPPYHHTWKLGQMRGEIIGYYGTARLPDGRVKFHVMSIEDIEARRLRAQSKDNGPWQTDYAAMCRKTTIRAMVPQTPMSAELSLAVKVDEATVTRETSGDLKVSYQEAIDASTVGPDDLQEQVTEALNAVEPSAQRLACSRQVLAQFGGIDAVTADNVDAILDVITGWPGTKVDLADQAAKKEGVSQRVVPEAVAEVLAGLESDGDREVVLQALENHLGSSWTTAIPEDELLDELDTVIAGYLVDSTESAPDGDSGASDAQEGRSGTGAANVPHTGVSGAVPDELLASTQLVVNSWDVETCKRILLQFGLPRTGNLDSMRLRLITHLAPLRHADDPAATDLF